MNLHRSALTLVSVMLTCALTSGELAAQTDRVAEGRAHFSRGVEYYKDEDYRNAMVEFKRAYELAPNYKLLYNLGQTAQDLKDYAFALKSLERYVSEGGNEIAPERKSEVLANIRKLKQRVAEVTIHSNLNDAELLVDDVPVGRTPLASALVVSAGRRSISLTKGSVTTVRTIEVAGGERTELTLNLETPRPHASSTPKTAEPAGAQPQGADVRKSGPTPTTKHTSQQPERASNPTWIGVVATSVFAVAAGVTGGLALAAKRDFDARLDDYPITPDDVKAARSKTQKLALATDILGGAAVLSCGITVWMALSNSSSDTRSAKHLGLTIAPTGLTARGSF
jgi:tetratricopeptide (TPR) repeat protein